MMFMVLHTFFLSTNSHLTEDVNLYKSVLSKIGIFIQIRLGKKMLASRVAKQSDIRNHSCLQSSFE